MVRKSKKPQARRPRRAPRRRAQATTNVNKSLQPLPNRYICKMKYATTIATDASGQYVMNLNSLFDPDRTGSGTVGHQPYGFDNLALIYNRYRVISTGWRIQTPMSSTGVPLTIGCLPSNDPNIIWPRVDVMLENPRAKYITQNPGAPASTLSGKIYIPKLVGRTKAQYMADDSYQANVVNNPTEAALLYIASFASSNGNFAPGFPLQVILEFTVEFFDSKHLLQS